MYSAAVSPSGERRAVRCAPVTDLSRRHFQSPYQAAPHGHLLSNGSYSTLLTVAGSGYSRHRDLALSRWREDATLDPWGYHLFLRDVFNGHVWSAGYQPTGRESESYEASFFESGAAINRKDGGIRWVTDLTPVLAAITAAVPAS